MKKIYALATALLVAVVANSQSFSNTNSSLPGSYHSGGCVGVVDMNQDGLDDVCVLDGSNHVFVLYQNGDGSFTDEYYGQVSNANQWGMAIGDIDNNGHNDVFCGGAYDGVHFVKIESMGEYEHISLEDGSMFMQGANIADINNDGWLDAFGCHDDAESRIWGNDGAGNLVPENDWIDMATTPESDNSGNYGSVWTDFDRDGDLDLFIAKCRQFVDDPFDPRRINALFVNDGESNYSEDADARGLVINEQSWTSDFADIDNDGDYDCLLTNHSTSLVLLENDGDGYFTDITDASGLGDVTGFFLQAKMVDFDNDGWVDLLFAGGVEGCWHNNGDNTFSEEDGMFPYGDTMHSFGIGDLNNDGWLDVYASYGNGYVDSDQNNDDILWLNDGGSNNWIGFSLTGIESNKNAIGATVEITGDFGTQIREVRAGESYGITCTFKCNFGLGEFDAVDLVTVYWPSGDITTMDDPEVNAYTNLLEAPCAIEGVEVSADGETTICEGESIMISAPGGYVDYVWNTGANSSGITVDETGVYSVVVYDNEGCAGISNSVAVTVLQPVMPTIAVNGDLEFCEGGSVTLISSDAVSYEWSNGEETQVITVEESGDYTVSVVDQCENPLESETITISVLDVADTPVVNDVTIDVAGVATFDAQGNDLQWYDSELAVDPVGTGDDWSTPWIESSTTYWVEDRIVHGGANATGGKLENGDGQYHDNSNYWLLFDAHEDIVIESVKVYADGEDERTIRVIDELNQTIDEITVLIPDGESIVTINLEVPQGTGYGLRSVGDDPQMWRDSSDDDLPFPYEFDGLATLTASSVNGNNWNNYYYFFYEWTVKAAEVICPSDRIEVQAIVLGVGEIDGIASVTAYPNPVNDILNVEINALNNKGMVVSIIDGLGRTILSQGNVQVINGTNNIQLDLGDLAAGVYQLQLTADGQQLVQQLVVE